MKKAIVSCVFSVILFLFNAISLTACMKADDYYTKAQVDSLIEQLQITVDNEKLSTATRIANVEEIYNQKITIIEDNIFNNQKNISDLTTKYNETVEELINADKENEQEIIALDKKYTNKVALLDRADETNANALATLKNEYLTKVKELASKDSANEQAILDLDTKYNNEVTLLKQKDQDNADALVALKNEYLTKVKELASKDGENEQAILDLDTKYNNEVTLLKQKDQDNADALATLESEYLTKVKELASKDSANEQAILDLDKEIDVLLEKNKKLEDQLNIEKTNLQKQIDDLVAEYDARVANIEAAIATLEDTDKTYAERLNEIDEQIAEILNVPYHTVSFDVNGGEETIENQTIKHGEKATLPPTPTMLGYKFNGWYCGEEKWSFMGYAITEDIELTAKWLKAYDLSGISFNDVEYVYDGVEKEVTITGELHDDLMVMYSGNCGTKAGQYLAQAYILDGFGNVHQTLMATLIINKATLSFTMDGLEVTYDGGTKSLAINEILPEGVAVSYTNNNKKNAGTYDVVASFSVSGNYNEIEDICATLKINKATPTVSVSNNQDNLCLDGEVVFDVDSSVEGTVALADGQTLTIGTRIYDYVFTPRDVTNYNIVNGTVSITVKAKVEFYNVDGALLDIQYVVRGGYIENFTPTFADNSGYEYSFNSWVLDQDTTFVDSSQVYVNLVLTAKYEKSIITYYVMYERNGGTTDEVLTESYTVEDSFTVPTLSKTGYTFNGWTGTGIVEPEQTLEISDSIGNREYVANFTANTYVVTLDANGGICDTKDVEIAYDSIIDLPTPTQTHYTFLGWYVSDVKLEGNYNYPFNVSAVAKWELENAITISTVEDLKNVAYGLSSNYLLTQNIDLEGAEWSMLGDVSTPFTGVFEGNGYTISNYTVSTTADYAALFGANGGIIQNLNVTDAVITKGSVGAAVLVGNNSGKIYNCSVQGSISAILKMNTPVTRTYCGGMTAYSTGNVISSIADVEIDAIQSQYAGGLVGAQEGGQISNSSSMGKIMVDSEYTEKNGIRIGGLVGFNKNAVVSKSYSATELDLACGYDDGDYKDAVGGLVGESESSTYSECYSSGNITNNTYYDYIGILSGFVGSSNHDTINNCYTSCAITLSAFKQVTGVNGFILSSTSKITNCYSSATMSITTDDYREIRGFGGGYYTAENCFVASLPGSFTHGFGYDCTTTNCYFYSALPNYSKATATTLTNFKSVDFVVNVLGWDASIWTLENGSLPSLDI